MIIPYTQSSIRLLIFTTLFLLVSCATTTTPEKTGLLSPKAGYTGELFGAKIKAITQAQDENITTTTVIIPNNSKIIETVHFFDKNGNNIKTVKPYEFRKDSDGRLSRYHI